MHITEISADILNKKYNMLKATNMYLSLRFLPPFLHVIGDAKEIAN